jgi:hypothetical protein
MEASMRTFVQKTLTSVSIIALIGGLSSPAPATQVTFDLQEDEPLMAVSKKNITVTRKLGGNDEQNPDSDKPRIETMNLSPAVVATLGDVDRFKKSVQDSQTFVTAEDFETHRDITYPKTLSQVFIDANALDNQEFKTHLLGFAQTMFRKAQRYLTGEQGIILDTTDSKHPEVYRISFNRYGQLSLTHEGLKVNIPLYRNQRAFLANFLPPGIDQFDLLTDTQQATAKFILKLSQNRPGDFKRGLKHRLSSPDASLEALWNAITGVVNIPFQMGMSEEEFDTREKFDTAYFSKYIIPVVNKRWMTAIKNPTDLFSNPGFTKLPGLTTEEYLAFLKDPKNGFDLSNVALGLQPLPEYKLPERLVSNVEEYDRYYFNQYIIPAVNKRWMTAIKNLNDLFSHRGFTRGSRKTEEYLAFLKDPQNGYDLSNIALGLKPLPDYQVPEHLLSSLEDYDRYYFKTYVIPAVNKRWGEGIKKRGGSIIDSPTKLFSDLGFIRGKMNTEEYLAYLQDPKNGFDLSNSYFGLKPLPQYKLPEHLKMQLVQKSNVPQRLALPEGNWDLDLNRKEQLIQVKPSLKDHSMQMSLVGHNDHSVQVDDPLNLNNISFPSFSHGSIKSLPHNQSVQVNPLSLMDESFNLSPITTHSYVEQSIQVNSKSLDKNKNQINPFNIEDKSLVQSEWIEKSQSLMNEKQDESLVISEYPSVKNTSEKLVQATATMENKAVQNGSSLNQSGSFEIINDSK